MKIVKGVIAGAASFLVIYLFGSFMAWSFNPGEWSDYGRAMAGMCGVFAFVTVSLIVSGALEA